MDLYNASLGQEEDEAIELTHEQFEEARDHYQSIIDRAEAARRLAENSDFRLLVMEGYLTNEPKRLADLMASGRCNEKTMNDCSRQIHAVADFRNYMKDFTDQGAMAHQELVALEEARDIAIKEAEEAVS